MPYLESACTSGRIEKVSNHPDKFGTFRDKWTPGFGLCILFSLKLKKTNPIIFFWREALSFKQFSKKFNKSFFLVLIYRI